MRIAVVSDVHGNLTALEAVLADLRQTSPDLILHGGDLAHGGASPTAVVDRIRDLGWPGVLGNTDEMLASPESLDQVARKSPHLEAMFQAIREMASATVALLGEERIAWLTSQPWVYHHSQMALVHASPESLWRAPAPEASDAELESTYQPLDRSVAIYAHIHRPFVRSVSGMVVANTGSVSLPYDGDPRASYLLVDDDGPAIRRVEYDVEKEVRALIWGGFPHSTWIGEMLVSGAFVMPS